jgi:hypothetical protein
MARTRRDTAPAVPATEAQPSEQDTVASTDNTEAAQADGQAAEGTDTKTDVVEPDEKAAEQPLDLEPFKTAVQAAVAQRDASTGTVPVEAFEGPNKAYRDLPGAKGKSAGRKYLAEEMTDLLNGAINDPSKIFQAKAFMQVQNALVAAGPKAERKPKEPVDPTEEFVSQYGALLLAVDFHEQRKPAEVKDDWADRVTNLRQTLGDPLKTYATWVESTEEDKGDEPEVSAVVKRAYRLTVGRVTAKPGRKPSADGTSTRTPRDPDAPRRSIEAHIRSALSGKPVGYKALISELVKHKSTEYGDDQPSAGAISAWLKSPKARKGVQLVMVNGHMGAEVTEAA